MRELKLAKGEIALVDDTDFEWLNQWKWHAYKGPKHSTYYAVRNFINPEGKRRILYMHRLILGLTDRAIKGDHKDRNGLNNQRDNLRIASHSQNMTNRKSATESTSIYLGVHWHNQRNKWRAQIKNKHIGLFNSEIEAAKAYNQVALSMYGQFANINIV